MTIESVMPSKHLIFWHPLLFLPSVFPSTRVFSNESDLHIRWPKYWSFSFSISPSNEYLGLISFRTDWFDLLAVQGTLKSFLQHTSSKASILWHSASLCPNSHICTWLLENHSFDSMDRNTMWRGMKAGLRALRCLDGNFGIHHWKVEGDVPYKLQGCHFQVSPTDHYVTMWSLKQVYVLTYIHTRWGGAMGDHQICDLSSTLRVDKMRKVISPHRGPKPPEVPEQ